MKAIKVSVILPSFNVSEYITECIESVINQSMKDIEILCVDAGSTDGTLEILRAYEMKDDRIKVILSDRKSYGYQMNLGMDAAQGEYIGIVETDDYILQEMYEELYKTAKEKDADFVKADFYRFVGEGEKQDKALNRLSKNQYHYNRIIDIEKEQECFYFPINTWSGIYKKDFLKVHGIRHNETPGASYQDTGFWFQTFVYAKRACFVDKAYYMNRRDNPNSSVYSRSKVFCVCEEFQFIMNILKENNSLWIKFQNIYAYTCYQSYKGSLERIAEEYKLSFLRRFSEDFKKMEEAGILKKEYFHDQDWNILHSIMKDPEAFYRNRCLSKQYVYDEILKYEKIIIYGAGMVGKNVYDNLITRGNKKSIVSFAVSQKMENFEKYKGMPIKAIDELMEYRKDSLVVVATTMIYQAEINKKLSELGFENILAIPE